jgi:hypothetical protein
MELLITHWEARGSVVGWGTTLQTGTWRVWFSMNSLDFLNLPNPSSLTMALRSIQPLTEIIIRNIPWSKWRPARKADNLMNICDMIV